MIRRCNLLIAYLFNRVSFWVLGFILMGSSVAIIISSGIENPQYYLDMHREQGYLQWMMACVTIMKVTLTVINTYLIIQAFYPAFTHYNVYFIQNKPDKKRLFISKMMALGLIEVWVFVHLIIVMGLTRMFATPYGWNEGEWLALLGPLLVFGWVTLFLGIFAIQLVNSLFSGLFPLMFFYLLEHQTAIEYSSLPQWMKPLLSVIPFPFWSEGHWRIDYKIEYTVILMTIFFLINLVIFSGKDIK